MFVDSEVFNIPSGAFSITRDNVYSVFFRPVTAITGVFNLNIGGNNLSLTNMPANRFFELSTNDLMVPLRTITISGNPLGASLMHVLFLYTPNRN